MLWKAIMSAGTIDFEITDEFVGFVICHAVMRVSLIFRVCSFLKFS